MREAIGTKSSARFRCLYDINIILYRINSNITDGCGIGFGRFYFFTVCTMPLSSANDLIVSSIGIAAIGALSLAILQTDAFSRQFLSTERLQSKRTATFVYKWRSALSAAPTDDNDDSQYFLLTLLTTAEEIDSFVKEIISGSKKVTIGKIALDERIQSREYFLWLYDDNDDNNDHPQSNHCTQVPLALFGEVLANAMDRVFSSTTFCFVADVAAGQISKVLPQMIPEADYATNPLWLTMLSVVMQRGVYRQEKMERILYALCRLSSHSMNGQKKKKKMDTFVITYATALVPTLLPLLQSVFPDDRHVFAYAGCVQTVELALNLSTTKQPPSSPFVFTDPVAYTTPLTRDLLKATSAMPPLSATLQNLGITEAQIVETWMGAVNAFFLLKEEEKKNGYLPYVLKMEYLWTPQSQDVRHWTTRSLIQYVTGSRSRGEISSERLDAAFAHLQDYQPPPPCSPAVVKKIENCVFQHKLILIANKTLQDTVQPSEHWTLKAAARGGGCACCAPEEDDDEEEEDWGALASKLKTNNKPAFVDGATTFAFDPTKF